MGQARHNPRSMAGAGRVAGKTEDTVNEARLREMLKLCSGPEELRAYVALNFKPHEREATYRYLLGLAPWTPEHWKHPRPDTAQLTALLDPMTFEAARG